MSEELNSVPQQEPERQYYFIEKLKDIIKDMESKKGRKITYCITTFGCQMNARDSEKLAGILEEIGYVAEEEEKADFVIFNTCSIRENANTKVYGHLGHLNAIKKTRKDLMIGMCGCMMQEPDEIEKIQKQYRFVDIVFGTHNIFKFAELIYDRMQSDRMIIDIWKDTNQIVENIPNARKFPFKSGVNITFGCNNFCTYCIVPYVRGRERSREAKEIIREIEKFVADGVKEVMLLGQNVNSYGNDLDDDMNFPKLLKEVCKIEGLKRVRFMTPHPKDLSDELIAVIARNEKVCRHIHLPLQSGSTAILKKMNRRYTKEAYLELAAKIREQIPEAAITTDIIVGFPGETEEDFLDTVDVVRKVQYESAFTFIYSKREGTPAASMPDQVPEDVVKDRFNRLMKAVNEVAEARCGLDTGKRLPVLVEGINEKDSSFVTGRLSNNTLVHFKGSSELIGEIVDVTLKESKGFYYIGEM